MRISDWSSDVCSSDLIELGYEVESHQALLFPLRRLVGDLATYLSVRDGGVQRFVLRLEHEQTHTDVVVGLLAAEREPGVLFELTRSRLEQASIPKPVVAVRLLGIGRASCRERVCRYV